MFATARNPAKAYARIGMDTAVESASPHKLIVLLFEGAMLSVKMAESYMDENRIPEKGLAVSRAIDIISNGLQLSLDRNAPNEIGERLDALYQYMISRLLHGNLHNDRAALSEVYGLLGEIKGAWQEIANEPVAVSDNAIAA